MTDKPDDPIIDACLDEVLGGQRPPHLTERILRAMGDAGNKAAGEPPAASLAARAGASPTAQPTATVKVRDPKRYGISRRQASPWLAIAASLTLVGLGSAFVWVAWSAFHRPDEGANQIALPEPPPERSHVAPVPLPESLVHVPSEPRSEPLVSPSEPARVPDNSLAIDSPPATQVQELVLELDIPDERPAPLADEQIVRAIDELIRNGWQREGITPATPASDEQWCERVYAKLIGRVPSPRELSSFLESRSAERRSDLVNLLLDGDIYVEEFAAHWSRNWADILIASGDKRTNRDGLEQYLRRAFGESKPFDETTSELLTATGSGKIGADDYNGAVNFLVAYSDREGVHADATARVSRTFMAMSLECSRCHVDSTWSGIEQQRFWELNAFFRQLEIKRDGERGWLIADADIASHSSSSSDGETYYPALDGTMKAAYPVFVDGTAIPRAARVEQVNRRNLLAKFVTRSEQFRQAMANRFWAELFGVGFTIPADNIGPHNPPSHPELLAKLGAQFAAHDYDVRSLIRWITLSEAFALSSGDVATHDQIGARLAFDRFPRANDNRAPVLNQLRVAREAYASIVNQSGALANSARINPTADPGAIPTEINEVDKRLATVGANVRGFSKSNVYGSYILGSDMSLDQKVQHMFFATLHRAPTASEQKAVEDVLGGTGAASDARAFEYIWWALASSQEAR